MVDEDRLIRELYAETRLQPRSDHPDEGDWEELAVGELPEARRQALVDHVARCADCTELYRGVRQLVKEAAAFDAGVPYLVNVLTDPEDAYPRSSNLA